ncbi:hypothetical protein SCLCIDRAFT_1224936 [Scleroderma citrinum Foug A]|uniref:Uncharacterized protein n=1 Tax=Scleroderma citrinum Foug A TaxID=1036808 RepID=A0A0C2YMQ2_9AGAM|nr:hypothetical protein SCLCIDRAFT_1224936 [Scleroderma citrinum Foug A]
MVTHHRWLSSTDERVSLRWLRAHAYFPRFGHICLNQVNLLAVLERSCRQNIGE